MKKYSIVILFAIQCCVAVAQNKFQKEPYLTKSLSSETIKNVFVETSGGSITVQGVPASEMKIEVYVAPSNSNSDMTKEELDQRLKEKYDLNVSVDGNKLTATAKSKENIRDWKKALSISFKIYVSTNVSTDLSTSGGSIKLSNLNGNLGFSTSGGSLNLEKVGGVVKGRTSGGSINLEDSKDDIDLSTSGGSIYAKNCDGKIRLHTSGGSLDISDLKGSIDAATSGGSVSGSNISGDLKAHTSGGSVMLNSLSCNLDASTSGGNIRVEMKELRNSVDISNSSGAIDLIIPAGKGADLRITGDRIKTDKMSNFDGTVKEDDVRGKLNGGGTSIRVNGGSSRVYFGFTRS